MLDMDVAICFSLCHHFCGEISISFGYVLGKISLSYLTIYFLLVRMNIP